MPVGPEKFVRYNRQNSASRRRNAKKSQEDLMVDFIEETDKRLDGDEGLKEEFRTLGFLDIQLPEMMDRVHCRMVADAYMHAGWMASIEVDGYGHSILRLVKP